MAYATAAQLRAYLKIVSPGTFTASAAADILTFTDVQLTAALRTDVRVTVSTTNTLPAPLAAATVYYVRSPSGMTCQLAATPSGAAIELTTAGVGTHTLTLADNDDTLLAILIANAQALIDHKTGRTFEASGDTTRYYNSRTDVEGRTLYLDTDLCQITSITNGDGDVLVATEYTTIPKNTTPYYAVRLLGSSSLAWEADSNDDPEDAITIVGRFAYSTTAPTAIYHATLRLAAWLYRQKDTSSDLDRPLIAEGVTILPMSMPRDVEEICQMYHRAVLR